MQPPRSAAHQHFKCPSSLPSPTTATHSSTLHTAPPPSPPSPPSSPSNPSHPAGKSLDDLTVAATAARDKLRDEIIFMREGVQRELEALIERQRDAAERVEKAAKELALHAMQLDNRALELERGEMFLRERGERIVDRERHVEKAIKAVKEREVVVTGRELALRYSAVEHARLYEWERQLDERQERVQQVERRERERIAEWEATLVRREIAVGEKERTMETALKERELSLNAREMEAERRMKAVERQRAEALMRIEAEREIFWAHQQKLSAVVAAEMDTLVEEQRRLRAEFEGEAAEARSALKEMTENVIMMRGRVERARRCVGARKSGVALAGEMLGALSVRGGGQHERGEDGKHAEPE